MSLPETTEATFRLEEKRVWVAGHTGMVGSALVRRLAQENCKVLTVRRREVDLTRQAETEQWIDHARPQVILMAAAKVGGIVANATYPAEFLYDNTMIAMNVMKAAAAVGVERLLWMGSSCIYPKHAAQPMREEDLLTGPLEPTNEAYAIAKIASLKLAEAYARQYGIPSISVMPTNLYGQDDNFDLQSSHVIPGMIRRLHEAKIRQAPSVTLWGSGMPLREFLHADDLADACVFLLKREVQASLINIGSGLELSIADLARLIAGIVGYDGRIVFDRDKPDGAPRKLLDSSRLAAMGWTPSVGLKSGIEDLYRRWQGEAQIAAE
ncbi:GDP-L-fucose synthase family protein [Rhizobium sp. Leaf341]|uniref:GDP-L-fucose synthase family protein n=1 Tax=Rhizobium sp. Leaf341 TaxID=1736344 RepID=UPI00071312EB|nr:GDP-L-fucose synthase [Rhizobium sp. Leaf341]KQR76040.1 GDP-fucose synthetase [Rhizobium sp. Leaf341]